MEKRLQKRLNDLEYTPSGSLWDRIDQDLKTDFEKKLENKFSNYSVKNHPENWDKIEPSLPSEKSGWSHFQTFAYAITGVAILGLIYLFMPKQPFLQTAEKNVSTQVNAPLAGEEKIIEPQSVEPEIPSVAFNKTTEQPVAKSRRKAQQRNNSNPTLNLASVQPLSNAITETQDKTAFLSPQHNVVKMERGVTSPESSTVKEESAKTDLSLTSDKSPNPSTGEITPSTPTPQVPIAQAEPQKMTPPAQPSDAIVKHETPPAQEIIPIQIEPAIIHYANAGDSIHKIQPVDPNAISTAGLNDPEKLTEFSIRVIAGAYACFNRLETPTASSLSFEKNKALRNSLESPGIDWSGLFLLDYRINDRWNISGGMGILNFSQSFYFNTVAPVSTTGNAEKGAQIIHPNDSIISGNNYSTRIKYSWTEIPVFVRYRVTSQPRFNLALEAGLSYAIISTTDAGMVSYDNVGVLLIKDKEAFPGIQNSWFATFAPTLTYKLNNEVTLGLMPSVKFALTSMVANKDWMQQYPYFAGLNATLTKRF